MTIARDGAQGINTAGDLRQKVAVLGLTFKPDTDDMRSAFDPAGNGFSIWARVSARSRRNGAGAQGAPNIEYFDDPYVCANGADVLGSQRSGRSTERST
jgi:UDPglucose 6-dehydrogenase